MGLNICVCACVCLFVCVCVRISQRGEKFARAGSIRNPMHVPVSTAGITPTTLPTTLAFCPFRRSTRMPFTTCSNIIPARTNQRATYRLIMTIWVEGIKKHYSHTGISTRINYKEQNIYYDPLQQIS